MKIPSLVVFLIMCTSICTAEFFNMTIYYSSNIFNSMFRKSIESTNDTYLNSFLSLANARLNLKRGKAPPFIYLNPGNTMNQTMTQPWSWYMEFMNNLEPTAAGLSWFHSIPTIFGMKEYFEMAKCPILACNLSPKDPVMRKVVSPSTVVVFNKIKVGIIGYISESKHSLYPIDEDLGFSSELEALWEECNRLEKLGVQIVIAIGFSDLLTDLKIAEAVECLDIVIGSDFEIFSWDGTPLIEFKDVREPVIVQNFNGKKIPVLQLHDRILGELNASFNDRGQLVNLGSNIAEFNGNYTGLEYEPSSCKHTRPAYLFSLFLNFIIIVYYLEETDYSFV